MMFQDASSIKAGDVMTKDVLAIDANDTLDIIAGLFQKYDYDGMPVIDADHRLLGVITTHDLVVHSADVHLPTLLKILGQVGTGMADRNLIERHFGKLRDIKAISIMNPGVVKLPLDATLEQVAQAFADHVKANPVCIVDADGRLAGIIARTDIIRLFNEAYLNRVVHSVPSTDRSMELFPTKSEQQVEGIVKEIESDFLLVRRTRPLVWRYVAIATFIAGVIAAAILVIHIAQRLG